jgi:hypothetical protein
MTSVIASDMWKNFRYFNREAQRLWKVWSENESCSQKDKKHSEFPAEGQWIPMISDDRKNSYRRLSCEMTDAFTNRFSEILGLKLISVPDFGRVKHFSENISTAIADASLSKSYGRPFF